MTTVVDQRTTNLAASTNRNGPLFVLSVWRSGSSLLYTLLNQHSQIGLLYEGDLPRLHRFLWGRFQNGSWRERWEFWNQGPSRHGIAIEAMPANVQNAWEATRLVYQEVARRKQATIWGEKTPHWYDCPLQMADNFPDARFIFLWRDMHAVVKSIARAARTERFFRKAGFTERVLLGAENLRQACDALKAQGRPTHEVNYEDLTSNPSESMKEICDFLEVPFEERMISLEGADRSAIASGRHHTMVRSDRIVGQRKRAEVLTPAMRGKINRYIGRWKQRYHGKWPKYPLVLPGGTRPPSFLELWRDQIFYQVALARDEVVAVIYAVVPTDLARGLRSWLRQRSHKTILLPM
jgi:Sulfotransferase family